MTALADTLTALADVPPGVPLLVGAFVLPFLRGRVRSLALVGLPLTVLVQLWLLPAGHSVSVQFFDYTLELVRADALNRTFAVVFGIAAVFGAVYSLYEKDDLQGVSSLVYAGSATAALFAGDLIPLFLGGELRAIASVFLVWARRTPAATAAGFRYLVVQVLSGVLLLAGAILRESETGSLVFGPIGLDSAGGWLIFLAFGIKAAFPLLHNWLQDSYPAATITGTVFLSSFTTKLAIYALARGFAGTDLLIPIGAVMTAFPIFYAVIENDLRRVLAYSLNNQLGYMVVGVGIGTELALNGTVAHVFAHVIYKALLFMSMGAVLLRTGTTNGSDLGGLYKSMPLTTFFCIIGAASISGFPLTSGFVTKSMILTAAAEEHHTVVFLVLLFASAGVFHHSGIKIPFFAFFAHDRGHRVAEAPRSMLIAMGGMAALCIGVGVAPSLLYRLLPFPVDYAPYTTTHVVGMLQLLLFSALAFAVLMRTGIYPPELRSTVLDFDWVYRFALPRVERRVSALLWNARGRLYGAANTVRDACLRELEAAHRPWSALGEPWPTGLTALCGALLLAAYLVL
jgi:multicomponent Na+:H+ antiporter subunit D